MIRAFGWFTVYGGGLLVLMALYDYLVARWHRWWHAYLARQLGPFLVEERRKHAADIEARRREHEASQRWLLEMHRFCLQRQAAQHREATDRAVAEALVNVAPHPIRRAS